MVVSNTRGEAEQTLLDLLRDPHGDDFVLTIVRTGNRWTVAHVITEGDDHISCIGRGNSFAEAWHDVA
jgi:hypothetical protein